MKSQRRGRGEGSIKPLPNGKIRVRISYIDGAGKRQQTSAYYDSIKEAVAWRNDQQAKNDRGQLADAGRRTVGAWLTEWLEMKKPQVEPNTYEFHESNVRLYISPAIGRTPLAKLR